MKLKLLECGQILSTHRLTSWLIMCHQSRVEMYIIESKCMKTWDSLEWLCLRKGTI